MVRLILVALVQYQVHTIDARPGFVQWGYHDASVPPALTIRSGDFLEVTTLVTGARNLRTFGVPEEHIRPEMEEIDRAVEQEGPHLLVGPVAVEGAEPGDALEIRIVEVEVAEDFAINLFRPGGGTLPERFPHLGTRVIPLDRERDVAIFSDGIEIPLRPFFGSIGVAPPNASGRISSGPPGFHTGNIDNKELVAGSTLWVPVHVRGALLTIGDGHAAQGNGEVDGTALETSLRGTFQVTVRKGARLKWPRAETPEHLITMGLHPDLDEAAKLAVSEMVDYLVAERGLDEDAAYMLCSIAVDLHVTQIVDGTKGIHALLPKRIFAEEGIGVDMARPVHRGAHNERTNRQKQGHR
ncbi:MAG TPA: acetamidase/formamidase family protein [Vicinamibacteria bacterium]|nr:acetamidase/formamidase family protein [Vicinamibacteria bacterium]